MKEDKIGAEAVAAAFQENIKNLSPNELRKAYSKEARSYDRLKRAAKDGFVVMPPWDAPSGFRDFLRDMGPAPSSDMTVDRIDPDLRQYGPGLCRWADKPTQTRNRRNTVWLTWRGQRITLRAFADELGMPYTTVHAAIRRGESPSQIAARNKGTSACAGSYRPAWAKDEAVPLFYEEYQRWLSKLARRVRPKARPELFDAIFLSGQLKKARACTAIDEMTPDEHEAARAGKYGPFIRLRTSGMEWIEHALIALAEHDRPLAEKLWPTRVRDLYLYEDALLPPPPESTRS